MEMEEYNGYKLTDEKRENIISDETIKFMRKYISDNK